MGVGSWEQRGGGRRLVGVGFPAPQLTTIRSLDSAAACLPVLPWLAGLNSKGACSCARVCLCLEMFVLPMALWDFMPEREKQHISVRQNNTRQSPRGALSLAFTMSNYNDSGRQGRRVGDLQACQSECQFSLLRDKNYCIQILSVPICV